MEDEPKKEVVVPIVVKPIPVDKARKRLMAMSNLIWPKEVPSLDESPYVESRRNYKLYGVKVQGPDTHHPVDSIGFIHLTSRWNSRTEVPTVRQQLAMLTDRSIVILNLLCITSETQKVLAWPYSKLFPTEVTNEPIEPTTGDESGSGTPSESRTEVPEDQG